MNFKIVVPTGVFFEGEASAVVLPDETGEIGILPGHRPLLGLLGTGIVVCTLRGGEKTFAVNGGFFSVKDNCVSLVTDEAANADSIDVVPDIEPTEREIEGLRADGWPDPEHLESLERQLKFDCSRRQIREKGH
jgi:F-type H+-transporting ATPase subunit epsilon